MELTTTRDIKIHPTEFPWRTLQEEFPNYQQWGFDVRSGGVRVASGGVAPSVPDPSMMRTGVCAVGVPDIVMSGVAHSFMLSRSVQ